MPKMDLLNSAVRFACFDISYMVAKGVLDFSWCHSLSATFSDELFTAVTVIPVFLVFDFTFRHFEKRERLIYFYDMLVMLLSVFFITAIWRGGPGFWSFGGRAVKMMGHWTDVAILDGPLLVAALSGYG